MKRVVATVEATHRQWANAGKAAEVVTLQNFPHDERAVGGCKRGVRSAPIHEKRDAEW